MREHWCKKLNIKAIILTRRRDFGRCPLASRLPTALWPVAGRPVLEHLLWHLSGQGIEEAVICSNGDGPLLQRSIARPNCMQLKFLDEELPAGTAGCIRDAAESDANTLFLVFRAVTTRPPRIDELIRAHRDGKSDLTIMFEPNCENGNLRSFGSEIYVCGRSVLKHIPEEGYCDIKEGLIPVMIRAGGTVHAAILSESTGHFRDRAGYLAVIADYLERGGGGNIHPALGKWNGSGNVLVASSARIHPEVRIYGPVVILDNATVSEGTIIFGPTIVGRNVSIGRSSFVEKSVFWDDSSVGQDCQIHNCVLDYGAIVRNNNVVCDKAVVYKRSGRFKRGAARAAAVVNSNAERLCSATLPLVNTVNTKLHTLAQSDLLRRRILRGVGISILAGVFLWAYWPEFIDLWDIWRSSDEYSSGLLVPFLAAYVLWDRRHKIAQCHVQPSIWGLFAFIGAQAVRYFGLFFMYSFAERFSLVLSVASLTLFVFGWEVFRKVFSVMVFLCLMLPLPRSVHEAVMLPLQNLATTSAVFCLEVMGYTVVREGNIIHLNSATVAVAEACNGLRMVTSFFVIASLVALLVQRLWWEKLVILISSLPIALLCNAVRLTVTAVAFTAVAGERWEGIFHDFGGYAVMPLALSIVVVELWLLTKLTRVQEEKS